MRIEVHGTGTCCYCRLAEALLARKQIAFRYVDVTGDVAARAALVERTGGRRTVPVIFLDGQPIGGYTELAALAASGELERRLEAPSNDNAGRTAHLDHLAAVAVANRGDRT
jgi:glutaredoxin 3